MSRAKFNFEVRQLRAAARKCRAVYFEESAPPFSRVAFTAIAAAGCYKFRRDSLGNRYAVLPINRRGK